MLLAAALRGEEFPGSDHPVFFKSRPQTGHSFQGGVAPDGLIFIYRQDRPVRLFGLHRQDLPRQEAVGLGLGRPLMGADAPLIQIFLGKARLGK